MKTKMGWTMILLLLASLFLVTGALAADVEVTWTMPTEDVTYLAGFTVTIDGVDACSLEDPTATTLTCIGAVSSIYGSYSISVYAFDEWGQPGLPVDPFEYTFMPPPPGKPGAVAATITKSITE